MNITILWSETQGKLNLFASVVFFQGQFHHTYAFLNCFKGVCELEMTAQMDVNCLLLNRIIVLFTNVLLLITFLCFMQKGAPTKNPSLFTC